MGSLLRGDDVRGGFLSGSPLPALSAQGSALASLPDPGGCGTSRPREDQGLGRGSSSGARRFGPGQRRHGSGTLLLHAHLSAQLLRGEAADPGTPSPVAGALRFFTPGRLSQLGSFLWELAPQFGSSLRMPFRQVGTWTLHSASPGLLSWLSVL